MMNNNLPGTSFIYGVINRFLLNINVPGPAVVNENAIQNFNLSNKAKAFLNILVKCWNSGIKNFEGLNSIFGMNGMSYMRINGTSNILGWDYLKNLPIFLDDEKKLLESDAELAFVLLELASKFADPNFFTSSCRRYLGITDWQDNGEQYLCFDNSTGSHMYWIKEVINTNYEVYLDWLINIIQNYNSANLKDSSFLRKLRRFVKQIGGFNNLGFDISEILKAYKKTEAGKKDSTIKLINKEGKEDEKNGDPVIVDFKEWWSCIYDDIMACDGTLGTKNVYKLCHFGKIHTSDLASEEINSVQVDNKIGIEALKVLSKKLMSKVANLGTSGLDDLFEINPDDILPKEVLKFEFIRDVVNELLIDIENNQKDNFWINIKRSKIYVWLCKSDKFKNYFKVLSLGDKEKILDNILTGFNGKVDLFWIYAFAYNFAEILDMFKNEDGSYENLEQNHDIFNTAGSGVQINTKNPLHILQNLTLNHLLLLLQNFKDESKKNENLESANSGRYLAYTIRSLKPLKFYDGNKSFGSSGDPEVKMSIEGFKELVDLNEKFLRDKNNDQTYQDYLFTLEDKFLKFLEAFENGNQKTFMPKGFLKFIIGKIKPGSLYVKSAKNILDTIKSKADDLDFNDNIEDREILFELITKFKKIDKTLLENLGFSKDSRLKISLDEAQKYFHDAEFQFPTEVLESELLELKFKEGSSHSERADDASKFLTRFCLNASLNNTVSCTKKIFHDEKLCICTFRDKESSTLYRLAERKSVNTGEFKKAYFELKDCLGESDDVFWSKYQAAKKIIDDEIEKQEKAVDAEKKAAEIKKKNEAENQKLCDKVAAELDSVSKSYDKNSEKYKDVENKREEINKKLKEEKNLAHDEKMLLYAKSSIRTDELGVLADICDTVNKYKSEINNIARGSDPEEYKNQLNQIEMKVKNVISNYDILVNAIEKLDSCPYRVAKFFVEEACKTDRDQDSNVYRKSISDVEGKSGAFINFAEYIVEEAKPSDDLRNLAKSFIEKANVLSEGKEQDGVKQFLDLPSYISDLERMKTEFKEAVKVKEKQTSVVKLIKDVENSLSDNKQLNDENMKNQIRGLLSKANSIRIGDNEKALKKLEQIEKELKKEIVDHSVDNVKNKFDESQKNIKNEITRKNNQRQEKEKQEKTLAEMIKKQEKNKRDVNKKNESKNISQFNDFSKEISKLKSKKEYDNDVAKHYFTKLITDAINLAKSLNPEFYKSKLESMKLNCIAKINMRYEKDKIISGYISVLEKMWVEAEKIGLKSSDYNDHIEKIKALTEDENKTLNEIKSESQIIVAEFENKITKRQNEIDKVADEAEKKKAKEAQKALEKIKNEEKKRKEAEEKTNQEMLTKQKSERDGKLSAFKKQTAELKNKYSGNESQKLVDAADKKAEGISANELISLYMIDYEYNSILYKLKEELEDLKKKSAETDEINKLFNDAKSKIEAEVKKYDGSVYRDKINTAAKQATDKINGLESDLKAKTYVYVYSVELDVSRIQRDFMSIVEEVEKEKAKSEFEKTKNEILDEISKIVDDNKLDKNNNPAKEYLTTAERYKTCDVYSVQDCIDLVKKAKYELFIGENEKKNKETFNSLSAGEKDDNNIKILNDGDKYKLHSDLYNFLIDVCRAKAEIEKEKKKYPVNESNKLNNQKRSLEEKFYLGDDELKKFKGLVIYKPLFDNLENDETLKENSSYVYSKEIDLVRVYAKRFKKIYDVQKEFEKLKAEAEKEENKDIASELVMTISDTIDKTIKELGGLHFVDINNVRPEHYFDKNMFRNKLDVLKKQFTSDLEAAKKSNKIVNTKSLNDLKNSLSDEERQSLYILFRDFESDVIKTPSKFLDRIKILDNVIPNMRMFNEFLSELEPLENDSIIGRDVKKLLNSDENEKAFSELKETDTQKKSVSDYENKLNALKNKLKDPLDKLKYKKKSYSEFKELVEELNSLISYSNEYRNVLWFGGTLYEKYNKLEELFEKDKFDENSFDTAFKEFEEPSKKIIDELEKQRKTFNREVDVLINDNAFKTLIETKGYLFSTIIDQLRNVQGSDINYLKGQYEYLVGQLIYYSGVSDEIKKKLEFYFLLRANLLNTELSDESENKLNDLRKKADTNITLDEFEKEIEKYKKDQGIEDDWNTKESNLDDFIGKAKKDLEYSAYKGYFDSNGAFYLSFKELKKLLEDKSKDFNSKLKEFKSKVNEKVKEVETTENKNRQKVEKYFDKNNGEYKDIIYKDNGKGVSELDLTYKWKIEHLYKPEYLRDQTKFDKEFNDVMEEVEKAEKELTPEQKKKMEDDKKKDKAFSDLKKKYKNPTDEQKKIFDNLEKLVSTSTPEDFNKKIEEAKNSLDKLGKENDLIKKNLESLNQFKINYGIIIYVNGKDGEIKLDYKQFIDDLEKNLKNQTEFDKKLNDLKKIIEEAKNKLNEEEKKKLEENKKKLEAFNKLKEKYKSPTDEQKKIFDDLEMQIISLSLEDFEKKIKEKEKNLGEPVDDMDSNESTNEDIDLDDMKKIEEEYNKLDATKKGEYTKNLGNIFNMLISNTSDNETKKKIKEAKINFEKGNVSEKDKKDLIGRIVMMLRSLKLDIGQDDSQKKLAKILGITKEELVRLARPENIYELISKCLDVAKKLEGKEIGLAVGSGVSGALALAVIALVVVGGVGVLPFAVPLFAPFVAAGIFGLSSVGLAIGASIEKRCQAALGEKIQNPVFNHLTSGGKDQKGILGQIPKLGSKENEKNDYKLPN